MYINKSQGMALSAGANITGLNHTLHATADNTISTLQAGNPRESTQNRDFNCLHYVITGTEQHENANYWYRTTRKQSVICTGVLALASSAARTINYHLVCFALIWQFST